MFDHIQPSNMAKRGFMTLTSDILLHRLRLLQLFGKLDSPITSNFDRLEKTFR